MLEAAHQTFRHYFIFVLLCLSYLVFSFNVEQEDFYYILSFYTVSFSLYFYILKKENNTQNLYFFIGLGFVLRFIVLLGFPNLSDDIYRFIWDGKLLLSNTNPFEHLPSYYLKQDQQIEGISPSLYQELNSPNYFTIYPPICQLSFALGALAKSWWGSAFILKTFLLLCEGLVVFFGIKILKLLEQPTTKILIYVLNPLVIIEVIGNIHYEGAMLAFLLGAYYFLLQKKNIGSAIFFALSIASKLLPLIFLPFLIKVLGWRRSFQYFLTIGLSLLLLFLPFFSFSFIENFGNSLDLYFRKFEFNASLYYIGRYIGYQITGYNQIAIIGPTLAFLSTSSILLLSVLGKYKLRTLPLFWMFAIVIYLFCTTTIHPWYTILPLALCVFTHFRFPIIWSMLICLTYINYSYSVYFENLWIVGLEYGFVFSLLLVEMFIKKNKIHSFLQF